VVDQLLAAPGAAADADLSALPAPGLLARTASLVAARNMIDAEHTYRRDGTEIHIPHPSNTTHPPPRTG
jgi:hypothetical protein